MKLSMDKLGRAVMAVFVAQVVAGAMCLMPAVPAGQQTSIMHHARSHTRQGCSCCDAPAQAVAQTGITHGSGSPLALGMAVPVASARQPVLRPSSPRLVRILAPPDSSFLIHAITRRIRI